MQPGDDVVVKATGRRAKILEELGHGRFRVLFIPEVAADALDRDTPQDEDDAGGVYEESDLEVVV